ncbi:hypothetical protein Efla_001038 [Eimeria flavescens]
MLPLGTFVEVSVSAWQCSTSHFYLVKVDSLFCKCLGWDSSVLQIRVFRPNCLLPLMKRPVSQPEFDQLYEDPDFCTPTNIAPFLALQAMCTWALLYWAYKISLLCIVKRPNLEILGVLHQALIMLCVSVLLLAAGSCLLRPTTDENVLAYSKIYCMCGGAITVLSILLPRRLQRQVTYHLCVVHGADADGRGNIEPLNTTTF